MSAPRWTRRGRASTVRPSGGDRVRLTCRLAAPCSPSRDGSPHAPTKGRCHVRESDLGPAAGRPNVLTITRDEEHCEPPTLDGLSCRPGTRRTNAGRRSRFHRIHDLGTSTSEPGPGLKVDQVIAGQAVSWLREKAPVAIDQPWFMTVNIVNPHDTMSYDHGTTRSITPQPGPGRGGQGEAAGWNPAVQQTLGHRGAVQRLQRPVRGPADRPAARRPGRHHVRAGTGSARLAGSPSTSP